MKQTLRERLVITDRAIKAILTIRPEELAEGTRACLGAILEYNEIALSEWKELNMDNKENE